MSYGPSTVGSSGLIRFCAGAKPVVPVEHQASPTSSSILRPPSNRVDDSRMLFAARRVPPKRSSATAIAS